MDSSGLSEVPLIVNLNKVLLEEKKRFILNFAKVKLSKNNKGTSKWVYSKSLEFRVFKAIIDVCEGNQWSDSTLASRKHKYSF